MKLNVNIFLLIPKTFEEIPKMKTINSVISTSITYQKGKIIGHSPRISKDKDIKKHYDSNNLKSSKHLSFL